MNAPREFFNIHRSMVGFAVNASVVPSCVDASYRGHATGDALVRAVARTCVALEETRGAGC